RGVILSDDDASAIVQACGGLPLPLRLAVARIESGERPAAVLRWLNGASDDLAAYCVRSQAQLARARDPRSWLALIACALCSGLRGRCLAGAPGRLGRA